MRITVLCVASMAALLLLLGFNVSLQRSRAGIYFHGAPADPRSALAKAVRAHGNAAEWVPILAVLMLYLGSTAPPAWVLGTILAATASRFLAAAGFLACETLERIHPLKALGALGTYTAGVALCVAAALTVLR